QVVRLGDGEDAARVGAFGQQKALWQPLIQPGVEVEVARHACDLLDEFVVALKLVVGDPANGARREDWRLQRGEPAEIHQPASIEGQPAKEARRQWFAAGKAQPGDDFRRERTRLRQWMVAAKASDAVRILAHALDYQFDQVYALGRDTCT